MKNKVKYIGIAVVAAIMLSMAACSKNNPAAENNAAAENNPVVENNAAVENNPVAENNAAAEGYDYAKITNGDFSDFAGGYWVHTKTGASIQLRSDGTFSDGEQASAARRRDDGAYSWGIGYGDGGGIVVLFPIGVDMIMGLPSDTAKVRMTMGQDFGPESPVYYYTPTAPAYYATTNLRVRSEPDTSKDNRIATVPEGGRVELLEVGKPDYIDDISASWYRVKTADGTIGWVFGGYLEIRK